MYGLYHPKLRVFTVLNWWSLPSLSIDIKIYYYTYIWSLPCCIKSFYLSMSIKSKQWFSVLEFLQEWRQVSTKKCLKINLSCKRNFYPRYFSKYIYQTFFQNSFPPTDSRNLHKQKKDLWREIPTKENSNRNLCQQIFDNSISTKIIERKISTK